MSVCYIVLCWNGSSPGYHVFFMSTLPKLVGNIVHVISVPTFLKIKEQHVLGMFANSFITYNSWEMKWTWLPSSDMKFSFSLHIFLFILLLLFFLPAMPFSNVINPIRSSRPMANHPFSTKLSLNFPPTSALFLLFNLPKTSLHP